MTETSWRNINWLNKAIRFIILTEMIILVIASLFFFASLYYLWILVDTMQIICFMLLLDVSFPANFHMFLLPIFNLVFFKVVSTDKITSQILSTPDS